ncbi:MAG: hypothetical protein U0746_03240 [Gemmataceae bacterium]
MTSDSLDFMPLWLLFVVICVFTGLGLEGGFRFGRQRLAHTDQEKPTAIGAMVGSLLALLAFVLAFTFGLAANRFDARRQVVLDEANAIETTYRRAGLLSEPQRAEIVRLLREYVDVRVRGVQEVRLNEMAVRSTEIHGLLWTQATKAAERNPSPIVSLFIQSLNQMIELHAKRVQVGVRSRIPISIWAGLVGLAFLGMASVGYQAGLSATRRSPIMLALILAFGGVLFLAANLDRGYEGVLSVSQQAMIDVQTTLNTGMP